MENKIPSYPVLWEAVKNSLLKLGGYGTNAEINNAVYKYLNLDDNVIDVPRTSQTSNNYT